jgi:hypothetical protein
MLILSLNFYNQNAIGFVLKQGGHHAVYHLEIMFFTKMNYSTYDQEFYALIQIIKYWHHYLLDKEVVMHMDIHLLIFVKSQ